MYIPIKDPTADYANYARTNNVGFLSNIKIKFPDSGEIQNIAIKSCLAFTILGASVFSLTHLTSANTDSKETTVHPGRFVSGKVEAQSTHAENKSQIILTPNLGSPSLKRESLEKVQAKLQSIGNFKLPENLKRNNYPKVMAEHQLNKGEYYLALVSAAEGFSPTIQPDNKGYFIGAGWNLTLNSMNDNEKIARLIGFSETKVAILKNMSHESSVPVSLNEMGSVKITIQQAMQAAYIIGEDIRKEKVIPGIQRVLMKHRQLDKDESKTAAVNAFNSLSRYEQDLLVYHGYKVGNQFLTFKNLILNVVDYANDKPTNKDSVIAVDNIVKELDYSFKKDGKKYFDTRAQEITSAMFKGPSHFAETMNLKINPDKKISPPRKI